MTQTVLLGEILCFDPLRVAVGTLVLALIVVPPSSLKTTVEGVLVSGENPRHTSRFDENTLSAFSAHDTGDSTPPPSMGENLISNSQRLDGSIPLLSENLGPGGEAGEPPSDEIHCSTPRASVEGSEVRPDRRRIQPPFFHARCQDRGRKGFPLDVTDCADSRAGGSKSEVDSSDPGAEGDGVEGRYIHVIPHSPSASF